MKILFDGSIEKSINKIVIDTFLNGVYKEYGKKLYIIYTGVGKTSDIINDWAIKNFPNDGTRNCFNAIWYDHYKEEYELFNYELMNETKPDLVFIFGDDSHDFSKVAKQMGVPVYKVEKI